MQKIPKRLTVIDGESLMDTRLPKRSFCIETLLPEGISMLGGAPKIGKCACRDCEEQIAGNIIGELAEPFLNSRQ